MSNSSLLDPNKNVPIGVQNTLEDPMASVRPSEEKATKLAQIAKLKAEELARSSEKRLGEYATPEQIVAFKEEERKSILSKVSPKQLTQMANSLDSEYTSDILKKYLVQEGFSEKEANIIGDEAVTTSVINKGKLIDPERVTNRASNSAAGDLGLSVLQGVQNAIIKPTIEATRRSLTIPESSQLLTSTGDNIKGFTAGLFGVQAKEGNASINKFFDGLLLGVEADSQTLEANKSFNTQVSTVEKDKLIADFEATANTKFPNAVVRGVAGVLKGVESLATNPRALAMESAKQAPNLVTGGLFGSLSKKVLTRGMNQEAATKWLANEGREQAEKLSTRVGISTVALQEGMSNGVDAKLEVLNTDFDSKSKEESPQYWMLLDKGYSPEQARTMLSDKAFDIAFAISASVAAVTAWGVGTGKLNANNFRGTNPLEAGSKEFGEELIQSGTGAFATNVAASQTVDPERALDKGVGVAAGQGAITGFATGGGMGTVGAVLDGTAADVVTNVTQKAAAKLNVKFTASGNEFTQENSSAVLKGDYSNLKGTTTNDKITSVLDKRTMATFQDDPVKIGNHINKLMGVVDKDFQEAIGKLPETATDKERLAVIDSFSPSLDKLQGMITSINQQLDKQKIPLPENATDEEKANYILTFGSARDQEVETFDELANLANSPNINAKQKEALESLSKVRQTLSELRSSGSAKGMTDVESDVLNGTPSESGKKKDGWRGINTYVNNVLDAMKANVPAAANFNLKEMARFRDQRKLKFDLASAYVNATTKEGRQAAADAYMEAFGKSSEKLTERYKNKQYLVVPTLLKQFQKEYEAVDSALSGMANLVKVTTEMRATEAVESAFAVNNTAPAAAPVVETKPTVNDPVQAAFDQATPTTVAPTSVAPAATATPVTAPVAESVTGQNNRAMDKIGKLNNEYKNLLESNDDYTESMEKLSARIVSGLEYSLGSVSEGAKVAVQSAINTLKGDFDYTQLGNVIDGLLAEVQNIDNSTADLFGEKPTSGYSIPAAYQYTAAPTSTLVDTLTQEDKKEGNEKAEAIPDVEMDEVIEDQAAPAVEESTEKESSTDAQPEKKAETKTTADTEKKTSETPANTRTKKERIADLRENVDAPKWIKDAIANTKVTIKPASLDRAEKETLRNKERREKREAEKAAKAEMAAKVTKFKTEAYDKIIGAVLSVSDIGIDSARTLTKNLVAKWKAKLEGNDVNVVLQAVDAYVTGLKDSAVYDEPLNPDGKIYMAGFKMGKSINASASRGALFIQGGVRSVKQGKLHEILTPIGSMELLDFMKAADPLQYVLDYLDSGKPTRNPDGWLSIQEEIEFQTKEIAADTAKQFFTEFVATFDATYEDNTRKGSRYKDPEWASFGKESVQLFRKEADGKYPMVFKVAMAVKALEMLNNLPSYDHATRKEVASRLGMGSERVLTDEGYIAGLALGNTLNNEVESLGSGVLNFIGVKPNKKFDNNAVQTLIGSTGQLAFVVLENMGLVQVNYASVEQLDSYRKKTPDEERKGGELVEREKVVSSTGTEIATGLVPFVTIKKTAISNTAEYSESTNEGSLEKTATTDRAKAYSTFSQATNVSKNLEELFELSPASRIPTIVEPTMDDVPKYFSGTKQLVPEEQREAYLNQMKRKWKSKQGTSFLFEKFLTDTQAAIVTGARKDFTAIPKYLRAKAEAQFKAISQEIKQTRAALKNLGDNSFYMHLDAWRVGRTGYLNTILNPQASKFARHIMSMEDWTRDVDMNNEKQAELFKVALAFNFGITIDKRNDIPEVIRQLDELTSKPEFEELLWAYQELKEISDNENDPDYVSSGNDALAVKTFMELMTSEALWGKGATSSWSKVEALAEYSAMVQADGKPFTTSLMVEIDGITNGVMIANILFGIYDAATLAKGGIFMKDSGITDANGNPVEDFVEWTKDKGNLDSYQTLAMYTYEQFRSIFDSVADRGRRLVASGLKEGEVVLDDEEKNDLRRELGLSKKFPLNQKGVKLRLQQFNAAMAIVGSPLNAQGLITSAWRTLAKDPLMITNYGAAIKRVVANMMVTITEKMHEEIGNANSSDQAKQRANDIIAALNVLMPKTPVSLPENPLDFEMSLEQIQQLERFLDMAIGRPLGEALRSNYGAYNSRRDYINSVITAHEYIGMEKLQKRVNQWKLENGRNNWPSEAWFEEQLEDLKEDFTVLPSALSSDVDEGLMLNRIEKTGVDEMTVYERVVVESELNSFSSDTVMRNIRSFLGRKGISSAGVGALAYTVLGLDGATATRLMARFAVMNAHDGFGFAYDQVVEGSEAANQILVDAIQEHTFWENIRAKHAKVLAYAAANPENEGFRDMIEEMFINTSASMERSKTWEQGRDNIIRDMTVVQQYYYPTTNYRPNGPAEVINVTESNFDTVADLLVEEFNKQIENEDKGTFGTYGSSNAQFTPDMDYTVNSNTVLPLFEKMVELDPTVETPEHLDHLRNVLTSIVQGVVTPIEIAIASRDPVTSGEYNPETNTINMRIARESSKVNPQQSASAVYVHEVLHPVLETALATDSRERTLLDNIFNAVKATFKDASEMYPEDATDEEKTLMNGIYDYVFNNTEKTRVGKSTNSVGFRVDNTGNNYLSEFVVYSLTDRLFMKMMNHPKVLKMLQKPQFSPYESEGRSVLPRVMNSVTEWFITKVKQLMNTLTQKFFNIDGQLPSQMVFTLAGRLAGANLNSLSRMERMLKLGEKGNAKVRQAIMDWVRDPILRAGRNMRKEGTKGNLAFRAVVTPVRLANAVATGAFTAAVDKAALRIDLAHDGIIASLWRDLKGRTEKNKHVIAIHAMANKFVDQLRLTVRNDVVKHLRSQFKRKLEKHEKAAVNRILIRGDFSTLIENGMSRKDATDLINDKDKRTTLALTIRGQLRTEYTTNAGYYINMAKSLARKMHGIGSNQYDTPDNANMIARIAGNTYYKASGDLARAERLIDVLTTLEYMELQSTADINTVADLIKEDESAVFNTVDYHSVSKLEAFRSIFKNNKSLMRKGYIKEQMDPNVDIQYAASETDRQDLERKGYKFVGKVAQDNYDTNSPLYMYRTNTAGLSRYNAGATSLTGTNAKGTSIAKAGYQREDGGVTKVASIRKAMATHHQLAGVEGHTDSVKLEPLFNEDGRVVDYRYMMSQQDKVKLLNVNENYDENLAGTAASRATKKTSEEVNTKVVEIIWDDFAENFAKEPNAFLEVSATASKAEQREMYALLPKQMKEEIKGYFKDGKMYVRKDHYAFLFGYRKWSVTELGKKQFKNVTNSVVLDVINTILRSFDTTTARNIETGLAELAKMFKDVLVVKTGATLIANIVSNLITLTLKGVNPLEMVQAHFKGWMEITKYQKLRDEISEWNLALQSNRTMSVTERKALTANIRRNQQRIALSPVKDMVDEGVYQTITEDIADADGDYSMTSKLETWAAPVTSRIPNLVKDVGDILFMTHNTRMYKFLRNATQVSDFAARYVLHQHNLKQGKDVQESLAEITEVFVNYDLPTHKGLQYLNDQGLILFTKYLVRTQKVILTTLRDRPASVLALALGQHMFGINLPDITDVNLLTESDALLFRLNDPLNSLEGVAGIHLLSNGL